jgi:hypothetical protein
MPTKYILGVLAVVFLVVGIFRDGLSRSQSRTWLLIAVIFGAVSGWLWSRG